MVNDKVAKLSVIVVPFSSFDQEYKKTQKFLVQTKK